MTGHLLIVLATICLTCSQAASLDLHKRMSAAEIRSVFHVDSIDLVPTYEVVPLFHHINKRDVSETEQNSELNNNTNNSTRNKTEVLNNSDTSETQKTIENEKFSKKSVLRKKAYDLNYNKNYKKDNFVKKIIKKNNEFLNGVHNLTFQAFGQKLNLNLKPTEGLIKGGPAGLRLFNVISDPKGPNGVNYEEVVQEDKEHIGDIFQDEDNMAAVLLRKDSENGDILMEGSIGHELIIRPLPASLRNDEGHHHVVFKRDPEEEPMGDFAYMEPDRLQKRYTRKKRSAATINESDLDSISILQKNSTRNSRSKRSAPHVIYPEILVIVDYDGYRLHGGDNLQVKRYFVSFWNGVDLRYRLLKGPRVRISIAGIIISRGRDATPYLERNRVGRDAIDSAAALTDMGKYLFRERRLPVYDIAVAVTKLDMCRRQYANDACNRGTAGFAYVGGACVVNKRLEKVNSVAIIEDTGGFSGIIVAAHEVGHLLGAVHDGSPPPSYLGGPGAEKCRWEDGYIMSDLRHTERGFRWSPCTVQSFHHFLNGETASCLHNAPHEDEALARALPGTLLSLDAQCRRDRGTSACFKDERVCAQLFCFDAASGYCVAYRPAAEGSPCGDGQHCLDGRCVQEHENIIPDYSQHTPSYVRPETSPVYGTQTITTSQPFEYTTTTTTTEKPTTKSLFSLFNYFSSTTQDPYKNYYSQTSESTTNTPYNYYSTSTTAQPYQSFFKNYQSNNYASKTTTTTTATPTTTKSNAFVFNKYTFSTAKNPYDFKTFGKDKINVQPTTKAPVYTTKPSLYGYSTTRNSAYESYLQKIATTTRNPYNFDNFGKYLKSSTSNPHGNYLKRSYSSNYSVFGASSNQNPVNTTQT